MMTNKRWLIILALLFCFSVVAKSQPADRQHLQYSANQSFTAEMAILPAANTTTPRLLLSYEWPLASKLRIGAGTGFTFYNDPVSLVPVFVDLSYSLSRKGLAPYVNLKTGYGFSMLTDTDVPVDNHSGGLMVNPAIGIKFPTRYRFLVDLHAGFNLERATIEVEERETQTFQTDITYKRFSISVALVF